MTTVDVVLTPNVDTDQSASAQAQIDAAPNGTVSDPTIINMPAGRYRMDYGLHINSKSHIRWTCLDGVSTYPAVPADSEAFVAYTDLTGVDLALTSRPHFAINACTDVVGSFFRVEGPMTQRAADGTDFGLYQIANVSEHGFRVQSINLSVSTDCGWEDCSALNVFGDVFYVGGGNSGANNSNVNIHFYRITGLYNGRQGASATDVVGLDVVDVDIRKSGRSGWDSEPNGAWQRCWDVSLVRVTMQPKSVGFVIHGDTGSTTPGLPVRNRNYYMEDCTDLAFQNMSAYGNLDHEQSGASGYFVCRRYTRDSVTRVGMSLYGWEDITVEDCTVTTGTNTPVSTAVIAQCSGTLSIINNTFNGRPGTEGFDELYLDGANTLNPEHPSSYIHYGNVWAMGTQNDGGGGPQGSVAQTLPALAQSAAGVLGGTTEEGATATGGFSAILGSAEAMLGGVVLGAANLGVVPVGTLASSLPASDTNAAVAGTVTADVAETLPMLAQQAYGAAVVTGSIVGITPQTLPSLVSASSGDVSVDAVAASSLPMLTQVIHGGIPVRGSVTQSLPQFASAITLQLVRWPEWAVTPGDAWTETAGDEWLVRQ